MGYEKDYDLRFGNFFYLLSLRFRHHKGHEFSSLVGTKRIAKNLSSILTRCFCRLSSLLIRVNS